MYIEDFKYILKRFDKVAFNKLTHKIINDYDSETLIRYVFVPLLNEVRAWYRNNQIAIPELLFCIQLLIEFLETINKQNVPLLKIAGGDAKKIVLGVIEGDPHDLGKNIIKRVYDCYGFKVYDLGKEVSPEEFVVKAGDIKADIVGISTMMSTTILNVKRTIELLKYKFPKIKVMIGGAFVTQEIARELGADGYAESAGDLIEQTKKILN